MTTEKKKKTFSNFFFKIAFLKDTMKKVKKWEKIFASHVSGRASRWLIGKESSCQRRRHKFDPDQEDSLEEDTATHSSLLAWQTPWTGEPNGLQSIVSQRVKHNWANEHKNEHTYIW